MPGIRSTILLVVTLALVAFASRGWWAFVVVPLVWWVVQAGRAPRPAVREAPVEAPPSRLESTEQLQGVLSAVRDGVMAIDANGRLLFANDAAIELLALPGSSL